MPLSQSQKNLISNGSLLSTGAPDFCDVACFTGCCSVLQCVAEYCRVMQRVLLLFSTGAPVFRNVACFAMCCNVLQFVAKCCKVLQSVAACVLLFSTGVPVCFDVAYNR